MASLKAALVAGCGCAALGLPALATAQQATTSATPVAPPVGQTAATGTPPAGGSNVQEVVVTANKREQNINKVGLTITAVSGQQLAERNIISLQDVAAAVPGLNYAQSGTNTPIFTLRGVGFNETTLGVYPAVSVYLDQAPLPFPVLAEHSDYDLERIEVLKGPQGTLFGENSTGGAINYIAAKPTNHFESGGDLTYGRFNQVNGDLFVSGPITDTLKGRLSVSGLRSDGWQQSYTRPGDTNGSMGYYAGRLILDWTPKNYIRFSLDLNAWRDQSQPQAPQLIGVRPQNPAGIHEDVLDYPFSPQTPRAADWTPGALAPSGDRKFFQAALRTDIDLPHDLTLTSVTSYEAFTQRESSDEDGTALLEANLSPSNGNIHSINQEVRLASSSKSQFRWVVGGNFEHSRTSENQILNFGDDSDSIPTNLNIDTTGTLNTEKFRNYAVFANGEYDIGQLTLRAGARYTNTKDDASICGYSSGDGNTGAFFNVLGGLLGSVPFTPVGLNGCYVLNQNLVPGQTFVSSLRENNVSFRTGADYHLTSNTLLYVNISKGYKAGSYPTLSASTFTELEPVTQESVMAYEAGVKASLFDHRVQFDAAGFYYDYKNKQIRGKELDPVFGTLDTLVNVPKSRVYGLEGDITIRPFAGLTIEPAITYLDSDVQNYTGPDNNGNIENFAGSPLPFTPKINLGVNGDYRFQMANGGTPFFGFYVKYQTSEASLLGGETITVPTEPYNRLLPGVTNPFLIPSYATLDLRAGYEAPGGRWSVMAWGKNVTNKLYFTNSAQFLDDIVRYTGLPATYGVTIGFKFD